jgi:hypothetical protein
MMFVINDSLALSRPPDGPVAGYIVSFAEWLIGRGYGLVSLRNQVLMATGFSEWLHQNGIELNDIGAEHPQRYLCDRAHYRRPKLGDSAALRHLFDFLRSQNAIAEEVRVERSPSPIEQHVLAYEAYLQDARSLSRQTIINYRPFVGDFLSYRFGGGEVSLAQLTVQRRSRWLRDDRKAFDRSLIGGVTAIPNPCEHDWLCISRLEQPRLLLLVIIVARSHPLVPAIGRNEAATALETVTIGPRRLHRFGARVEGRRFPFLHRALVKP